jgi:membrane protein
MLVRNSARSTDGFIATVVSLVALFFGASGVFNQVQIALNKVWDVPPVLRQTLLGNLQNRLRSYLLVLTLGFLLLLFLVVSALASYLTNYFDGSLQNAPLLQMINLFLLFVILTVMSAMAFRIVPEKEISWADVWLGSGITAFLFLIGRVAIGWYLFFSKSGSTYGVAGSLIGLLIWIYYSAQIFLFGAEFTQLYARKFGSRRNQQQSQPLIKKPETADHNSVEAKK